MMTSIGPPHNDDKGTNKCVYGAYAAIFLAIKLKTLIVMSAWCLYDFISAVIAVLSLFWHCHGQYALPTTVLGAALQNFPLESPKNSVGSMYTTKIG